MLVSMTGFGRSVQDTPLGRITLEIQSVNRKYLEVILSLPKEMGRFEPALRKWISEEISRGQVSVRLFLIPSEEVLSRMLPDAGLLKGLKDSWTKIASQIGCDAKAIDLPFLLQNSPAASQSISAESEEEMMVYLQKGAKAALSELMTMKHKEGRVLAKDISARISFVEKIVQEIQAASPDAVSKQRDKLRERMEEVLKSGADLDERLLREIAFFAERIDITEEITRLRSHLEQFHSTLGSKDMRIGRKLEFILQEMGREINTIGSKSVDVTISRLVVDAKAELEKVREQIQNIE